MGYAVIIPRTKDDAVELIGSRSFNAAILSYTLSDETVKQLADLIRQACPQCPLLTISRSAMHDPHVQPDAIVNAEDGPNGLISALRRVLAKRVN
jgi:DNA-binding response OmpR family regulator